MMKGMFGTMLYYSTMHEKSVVNGVTGMGDLSRFQVKHQTFWTLDDVKRWSKLMNVSSCWCITVQSTNNFVEIMEFKLEVWELKNYRLI